MEVKWAPRIATAEAVDIWISGPRALHGAHTEDLFEGADLRCVCFSPLVSREGTMKKRTTSFNGGSK